MLIKLDDYIHVLEKTGGQVPEFVGPKFKEGTNEMIAPARLESLVAEYTYLLEDDQKVGVISVDRLMLFTCAKNSIEIGKGKFVKQLPMETLASCEFEWYYANALLLKKVCGVEYFIPEVESGLDSFGEINFDENFIPTRKLQILGAEFKIAPLINILPGFTVLLKDLKQRISSGTRISVFSYLELNGKWTSDGRTIDGSLRCSQKCVDSALQCEEQFQAKCYITFEEIDEISQDDAKSAARGFQSTQNPFPPFNCNQEN